MKSAIAIAKRVLATLLLSGNADRALLAVRKSEEWSVEAVLRRLRGDGTL